MTTILEAKDSICGAISEQWLLDDLSKNILIFYDKKTEDDAEKSSELPWARVTIKHFDSGFSNQSLTGSFGSRMYNRDGFVTIGIFTPIGKSISLDSGLVGIAMKAFEGKHSDGVWYKNVRFNEVGITGSWFLTNVKADFNYSEYK